jgi:hypothetical protein
MLAPRLDLLNVESRADMRREQFQLHFPAVAAPGLFLAPHDEIPERIRSNRNPLPRLRREPYARPCLRRQCRPTSREQLRPHSSTHHHSRRRASRLRQKPSSCRLPHSRASLGPIPPFVTAVVASAPVSIAPCASRPEGTMLLSDRLPVPKTCIWRTIGENLSLGQTVHGSPFRTFILCGRV